MSNNVFSLDDLNSDKRADDDDKHNDYYAGGEKSGQLIRGAPEDDESEEDDDAMKQLFRRARQAGARQGTADDLNKPNQAFQGTARTLAGGQKEEQPDPSQPRQHVIKFYRNGVFTVDNGPPRRVEDPANRAFIESIGRGECPDELDPGRPGAPVDVSLLRVEEDYSEPEKPKYTAFQGSGQTLGGSGGASSSASLAAAQAAAAAPGEWEGVNESKPTTSLQLRLADGSRAVARFNHDHKISDIRRFLRASYPQVTYPYQLMTAFPNKLIEDESQTLEAAGLLNAVIIQKKL